jgi:P27 family predicted phage terminase small subunit
MARTGRPPTSIEQRKAEGTLRSHHAKTPLLVGGRGMPTCPKHLKGSALEAFKILASDLKDAGILDKSDRTLLATAAMHYGIAIDAQEMVDRAGLVVAVTRGARDGNDGYRVLERNPAVQILRDALLEFRQCCDLLGIGPASRARLANMGVKGGLSPAQALPGIGAGPTPLRVVNGGVSE